LEKGKREGGASTQGGKSTRQIGKPRGGSNIARGSLCRKKWVGAGGAQKG